MKKFLLLLALLIGVVFTGQYLQRFAAEQKEDLGTKNIPKEQKEPRYATEQRNPEGGTLGNTGKKSYAEYTSTAPQSNAAAGDNAGISGLGNEITSAVAELGVTDISLSELESLLERLQVPTEKSEQGAAATGIRKVLNGSDQVRGLKFLEASFNVFEDGREELGFLRYVLDPSTHSRDTLVDDISRELGRDAVDTNANPVVWRIDEHTNMILVQDFVGNEAEEQGYLVSIEEEIH